MRLLRDAPATALAAGAAAGLLQLALAGTWSGAAEHQAALALGWGGALWLAWLRRRELALQPARLGGAAGVALLAGALLLAWWWRAAYRPPHRLLPLLCGVGLALLAGGGAGPVRLRRELCLLGLPLLDPLPAFLRARWVPVEATASTAAALLRLVGIPVARSGALLELPGGTALEVMEACSGAVLAGQLLALAVLVGALLPASARQRVALVLSAPAIAFAANAARVAALAAAAERAPAAFEFWDRTDAGGVVFPLAAVLCAGLLWWRVLRGAGAGSALAEGRA